MRTTASIIISAPPSWSQRTGLKQTKRAFAQNILSRCTIRGPNRLGLGLILHTHLHEQNQKLDRLAHGAAAQNAEPAKKSFFASLKSGGDNAKTAESLLTYLEELESGCCICRDLVKTMERYCEVITHLYFSEKDFRNRFDSGLGFCMPHFGMLLRAGKKNLSGARQGGIPRRADPHAAFEPQTHRRGSRMVHTEV